MKKILPPTLFLICWVLMILSHLIWPIRTLVPTPFNLLGFLPLGLGLFMTISSDRQFARIGTNIKTFDEPGQLVTAGWFGYSRNPMYLGIVLALVGTGILLGSLSPVLEVIFFTVVADRWYIPFEERRMAAKFGPAYQDYQLRVRRWL